MRRGNRKTQACGHGSLFSPPLCCCTAVFRCLPSPAPPSKPLRKLGLLRDIDLAPLHLPLRYEDETCITPAAQCARRRHSADRGHGDHSEVQLRPRRMLVQVMVDDGTGTCELRFFSFYPRTSRPWPWARACASGARCAVGSGAADAAPGVPRGGGELPTALTPVYPSTAGLPQPYLRRAIRHGPCSAPTCRKRCPRRPAALGAIHGSSGRRQRPYSLREALFFFAPPCARCGPGHAGRPQPPGLAAPEGRGAAGPAAHPMAGPARARPCAPGVARGRRRCCRRRCTQLLAQLPFALTAAQQRGEEIAADLAALRPCTACCRAMWAPARPWWPRWRLAAPSRLAGNAR